MSSVIEVGVFRGIVITLYPTELKCKTSKARHDGRMSLGSFNLPIIIITFLFKSHFNAWNLQTTTWVV